LQAKTGALLDGRKLLDWGHRGGSKREKKWWGKRIPLCRIDGTKENLNFDYRFRKRKGRSKPKFLREERDQYMQEFDGIKVRNSGFVEGFREIVP